ILDVAEDETTRVQRLAVVLAAGNPPLRDRDQPLDERPKLLRFGNVRLDPLVADQRLGLVAQQRDAMLRDAAEFSVTDSVTHGCIPCRDPVSGLRGPTLCPARTFRIPDHGNRIPAA